MSYVVLDMPQGDEGILISILIAASLPLSSAPPSEETIVKKETNADVAVNFWKDKIAGKEVSVTNLPPFSPANTLIPFNDDVCIALFRC
jgi:hypothetical protein